MPHSQALGPTAQYAAARRLADTRRELLGVLRSADTRGRRLKSAALGGDPESSFEQAFSQLAYTYIQDKAPRLMDHAKGFQLIERSEDNTRAAGVFGFQLGKQWIYVPVFFLSGDIKGHEGMYLKAQDMFVPLKESWVNYLMARKPHLLGEGRDETPRRLGVLSPDVRRLSRPPSLSKYGEADALSKHGAAPDRYAQQGWKPWALDFLPVLGELASTSPREKHAGLDERLSVPAVLAASPRATASLEKACAASPELNRLCAEHYGTGFLGEARRAHAAAGGAARAKRASAPARGRFSALHGFVPRHSPAPKLEIRLLPVDRLPGSGGAGLSDRFKTAMVLADDPDREKLLRDGYLVRDRRSDEEVSTAYETGDRLELVNPDAGGLYEVLTGAGEFDDLVVVARPHTSGAVAPGALVLQQSPGPGSDRDWLLAHRTQVWARPDTRSNTELRDWFEGLSTATPSGDGVYVVLALGRTGRLEGSAPFSVTETLGEGRYRVRWHDRPDRGRPTVTSAVARANHERVAAVPWDERLRGDGDLLVLSGRRGDAFRSLQGTLLAPEGHKVLKLADPDGCCSPTSDDRFVDPTTGVDPLGLEGDEKAEDVKEAVAKLAGWFGRRPASVDDDADDDLLGGEWRGPDGSTGSFPDLLDRIMRERHRRMQAEAPKAAALSLGDARDLRRSLQDQTAELKVYCDGVQCAVNGGPLGPKTAQMLSLVRDYGFREKTARALIENAERRHLNRLPAVHVVKYARGYPGLGPGPSAPAFPEQEYGSDGGYPGVMEQYPQEDHVPVDEASSSLADLSGYATAPEDMYGGGQGGGRGGGQGGNLDQSGMDAAVASGQSGQREVFDTALVATLLKSVRPESLVERFTGDLLRALDRLGRILFLFYWRNKEFMERYGKADLPELEDTLRNAFEIVGDLVLFLKEKDVGLLSTIEHGEPEVGED